MKHKATNGSEKILAICLGCIPVVIQFMSLKVSGFK